MMRSSPTKGRFLGMPQGFGAIYFTQLFSTISFAVIFSSLVLYMQEQVRLSATQADLITGVYFAYNFALHMLAGYLGGRFLSYRGLVIIGLVFQLIACLLLAHGALASLYWGLACMLIGTGTMVTCLNMLLSQLFQADEVGKRQSGFLWNYSGMNIGFILGFTLAGYFQLKTNYTMLFLLTAVNNIIAMVILFSQWRRMRDKDTIFSRATAKARLKRIGIGTLIILALVPLLQVLLHHTQFSDDLVLSVGFLMLVVLFLIAFKHHDAARKKLFAFIILIVSAQFFWIIYQLAPMSLTIFAKNNVNLHLFGFRIAPGWIQNVNSITIVIGGPLLALFFTWIRRKTKTTALLPLQYSTGLFLSSLSLLILPLGIALGDPRGFMAFGWLFVTYVLQGTAELLISPIGYSMVGQLIPTRWQGLGMGTTLLNLGVAAVFASFFLVYAMGPRETLDPLITNPFYSRAFMQLGFLALAVAVILVIATPFIKRLISGNETL